MTAPLTDSAPAAGPSFRHEALLYAGRDDFVEAAGGFIRDGIAAGEPTLVVVSGNRIAALREAVGDAAGVVYADMAEVGANPARIIPAWQAFVDERAATGRRLRGIGEPVWAERGVAELVECQRHERLLNTVFDTGTDFWLLCPYDTATLTPEIIEEARRSHGFVSTTTASGWRTVVAGEPGPPSLDAALPAPPPGTRQLDFNARSLAFVRAVAGREAARAGLLSRAVADLVVAVSEVAANSVRHGGGTGHLRVWHAEGALVCEVTDRGRVASPLVDRRRPGDDPHDARGLWLANQVCDLVQLRSSDRGTIVRLHMAAS